MTVAHRSPQRAGAHQGCAAPGGGAASRRENPYSSLHARFPGARARLGALHTSVNIRSGQNFDCPLRGNPRRCLPKKTPPPSGGLRRTGRVTTARDETFSGDEGEFYESARRWAAGSGQRAAGSGQRGAGGGGRGGRGAAARCHSAAAAARHFRQSTAGSGSGQPPPTRSACQVG